MTGKDNGNRVKAKEGFERTIELDPKYAEAHLNLGLLLLAEFPDLAEQAFRSALEIRPAYTAAQVNLAFVLNLQGNNDEAIRWGRRAVENNPSSVAARLNLSLPLREQGLLEEAVYHCRRAVEIAPMDARAHSYLGACLEKQRKFPQAVASFRKAIELDGQLVDAYLSLGTILSDENNDHAGAEEVMRAAVRQHPEHPKALCNLALFLYRQGKTEEARRFCERALELNTEDDQARCLLEGLRVGNEGDAAKQATDNLRK